MHFAALRRQMVEHQLQARGIADERVLAAMNAVPREEYVPPDLRDLAYDDCPLPLGGGQTISQPFTVAFQCAALQLAGHERVLEIGTGSGYAAAVLSQLAAAVYTIERLPDLAAAAEDRLRRLGYANVHCRTADGTLGWAEHAPYEGILASAGGHSLPQPLLDQLAPGGRIVLPLGDLPEGQTMYRFTKLADELRRENLGAFAFVPLIGRHGWNAATLRAR